MNRYLEIARQIVPDEDTAKSDRKRRPGQESSELIRALRLILDVFPGSQIVAVDEAANIGRSKHLNDFRRAGGAREELAWRVPTADGMSEPADRGDRVGWVTQ